MIAYKDERWCGNCKKVTEQICIDYDHERDSSSDYQNCLVCDWDYWGITGKWGPRTI